MPWFTLGAAAIGAGGAALSAGSGSGGMKPWSGVRQPMTAAAKIAEQGLYRGNFQGDRTANMTPGQLSALTGISALGQTAVNPMLGQARGALGDTLSGQYLENPYTSGAVQAAIQPAIQEYQRVTMPNMMGGLAATGGLSSSMRNNQQRWANEGLANALTNTSAQIGYQNYGDERNRMTGALGYVPGMTEASYQPFQQQYNAQTQLQTQNQREIDSRMQAWNEPFQRALQAYSAFGGAAMPSQAPTTSGMLGQALMGGLGGYSMARGAGYGGQGTMGTQQQGQPRPWVNQNW